MRKLLGLGVLVLVLPSCDGFLPPPPPPPPPTTTVPTPPPTPTPTPVPHPEEVKVGYTICCDNPGTPEDEALVRGWPFINQLGISEIAGAVDTTELRAGPGCDAGFDFSKEHLVETVLALNAVGILPIVDWWDFWCVKHGKIPGVAPKDFRNCSVPSWYDNHVLERLQALKNAGAQWINQTGNELWLAGSTTCHERRLVNLIRSIQPDAYIISNSCNPDLFLTNEVQACDVHGWWPATQPERGGPGDWNLETDQRNPGCDGWMDQIDRIQRDGGVPIVWAGEADPATRTCILNRLKDRRGVPH